MHIRSLQLRNYASHADTTLDSLGPVTVLVGPNGGGKSSLFEAIRTFSRLLVGPVGRAFGPPPFSFDDKLFAGANPRTMAFEAQLVEPRFPISVFYAVELGYVGSENVGAPPTIRQEVIKLGDEVVLDRAARKLAVQDVEWGDLAPDASLLATVRSRPPERPFRGPKVLAALASRASRVVNYRLEPRQLSMPSQEPDSGSYVRMGYEGDNLAACLYSLQENAPAQVDEIVHEIRQVIPALRGITVNTVGVDRVGFVIEYEDARYRVLAPNTSSGTLLILGLVTLLKAPSQPDIACLEEPETGLTPDAVRLFLQLLCSAAGRPGGQAPSQFFFSSHSPFVLVDAWNTLSENRSFIKRLHVTNGHTVVEDIQSIIDRGDSGAVLQKGKDGRTILGLKTAEELMCGRFL